MIFKAGKNLSVFLLALLLTGCYPFLYQPPVKQGNVVNPNSVAMLKTGMTKAQVSNIMGTPVLDTPLSPDTWHYIYTFKEKGHKIDEKQVTLYFRGDRLEQIA